MSSVEDELAKLQDDWDKAESGGTNLPDGMMTFEIVEASVGKSQASGRLQMGLKLKVVVGEHAGKTVWQYQGLDNANSMTWFKRNMLKLEVAPPAQLSEIPKWCGPALTGITYLGQVKNKDGFCNIYPQRRVEVDDSDTATQSGGGKLGM